MKFTAVVLLAFIAATIAGPVSIQDNNVGDIVTVGVNANAELTNQVDQTIVNVILALLNQQAIVVDTSDVAAPIEAPKIPEITPEMIQKVKALLN